jgi:hypothetical protein
MLSNSPQPISNANLHYGTDFQCLVNPGKIVMSKMQRNSRFEIFHLLAECICQPRKPPHRHPYREILPFDVFAFDGL